MARCHASHVAILHISYLQTRFCGWPGRELLKMYYASLSYKHGGCGFTALKNDRVLGYVCGIWDAVQVKRHFIRRFGLKAAAFIAVQLMMKPKTATGFVSRFKAGGISDVADESGYELRPIVVAPDARGTGIAALLVNELMADAARRGYSYIYLITEKDNHPANAFYRKHGFELISGVAHAGSLYNQYRQSTSEKSTR